MSVPAELRRALWQRANGCCEYCQIHHSDVLVAHEVDHVIAEQHRGPTILDNLAVACYDCNRNKGPNLASVDPETGEQVFIFNPRRERWGEHFRFEEGKIIGVSPRGRATAALLQFNEPNRLRLRLTLSRAGRYPPN